MANLYNLAWLKKGLAKGQTHKYIFFWSHESKPHARLNETCLSQWWPSPFIIDEVTYATAEHYVMAKKAELFDDTASVGKILQSPHPGGAKQRGRQVTGFDEEIWRKKRFDIVVAANLAKFEQNEELRDYLLSTGDLILAEASPVDLIWSIGLTATTPGVTDPDEWKGENLLGFALMSVRDLLRAEEPEDAAEEEVVG